MLTHFEEASRKVLPKLVGLRLLESTVERTTEAAGAEAVFPLRALLKSDPDQWEAFWHPYTAA